MGAFVRECVWGLDKAVIRLSSIIVWLLLCCSGVLLFWKKVKLLGRFIIVKFNKGDPTANSQNSMFPNKYITYPRYLLSILLVLASHASAL